MDLSSSINKIIELGNPHFILAVRQYGSVASPSIPVPKMNITEGIKKKQDAKIWVAKRKNSIVLLVEIEEKEK